MWQKHFLENVDFKRLVTEIFGFPLAGFPPNDTDFFDTKRLNKFVEYFNVHTLDPLSVALFHFLAEVPLCGGALKDFFYERYGLERGFLAEQYSDQMLIDWAVCNEFCHPREVYYVYLKTFKEVPKFNYGKDKNAFSSQEPRFLTVLDILNNLVVTNKKWEKLAGLVGRERHGKSVVFKLPDSGKLGMGLLYTNGNIRTYQLLLNGLRDDFVVINLANTELNSGQIAEYLNKTRLRGIGSLTFPKSSNTEKNEVSLEKVEVLKRVLIKDLKDEELEKFVNDQTISGRIHEALVMEKMRRNNSDSEDDKELFNLTYKPRRVITGLNINEETMSIEAEKPIDKKASKKEIIQHAEGITVGKIKKGEDSPVPGSIDYYKSRSKNNYGSEIDFSRSEGENPLSSESLINRYEASKKAQGGVIDSIRFVVPTPVPVEEDTHLPIEDEVEGSFDSDEEDPRDSDVNFYVKLAEKAAKSMDIARQEHENRSRSWPSYFDSKPIVDGNP